MINNEQIDDLIEQKDQQIVDCINRLESEILKEDVEFEKSRIALQVGTLQQLYVDFRYLLGTKKVFSS